MMDTVSQPYPKGFWRTMRLSRKQFWLVLLLAVSSTLGVLIFAPDLVGGIMLDTTGALRKAQYIWIEMPAIESQINKISGVTLREVVDSGSPDELSFQVTLYVADKGTLTLHTPTRTAFSGPEPFIGLIAIDDCEMDFSLGIGTKGKYPELRFKTVNEIIENYDLIYTSMKELKLCRN